MRLMMEYGLGLALVVAVLGACAPVPGQGGSAASTLAGTSWRLVELNSDSLVAGSDDLTLVFDRNEPRVSGNGGCNQFSGPYTQDGASLRFGPLVATRRACLEPAFNTQETAYFQALESTTRYSIDGGQLVLYSGNQVVARFASSKAR